MNKRKIKSYNKEEVIFTDGSSIRIVDSPYGANNYADIENTVKDSLLENMEFDEIVIGESDYGFLLNGHLINCYSEQNGYYSNLFSVYLDDVRRPEEKEWEKEYQVFGEKIVY